MLSGSSIREKVLEFFLLNPRTETHLSGLAKTLKLSKSVAKNHCDALAKEGILERMAKANLVLFQLNEGGALVRELKRIYAIKYLQKNGVERIAPMATTIAVYGSYASGDFDEQSDLDVLVLGQKSIVDEVQLSLFRKRIKMELQLTLYSVPQWEEMRKQNVPFVFEVEKKHVLLKGAEP
jgi:predicted nucleotidyltransferase